MVLAMILALICFFAFVMFLIYCNLKHHFTLFERLNIPGPKPSVFIGNLREIMTKGQFQATVDWGEKFGRVYGYYEGYTPVLSVSDPKILREILVKDSLNFNHRKPFPLAPRKSLGLFLENGAQWHRSRSLLTPAFSGGKLKQMLPIMEHSSDVLVDEMTRRSEEKDLDVYSVFQSLTLDVIGRCAFGLHTKAQTDSNDEFLVNIRSLFNTMSTTLILPLVMAAPFLTHIVFTLKNVVCLFGMNPVIWLRLKLQEVMIIRKDMGPCSKVVDLLQLMLFPRMGRRRSSGYSSGGDEEEEIWGKAPTQMTDREIVAQSLTFLLAGYETTSAVMAFLSRLLAENPDVQRRLQAEIDSMVDEDVSYESITELPYFEMVFDEVCRLYPTASQIVTRVAEESRTINGVRIPAGMNVHANIWALHHDPEFWFEPEVFDPERFSPENRDLIKPYTYLPFGAGPRKCIGMRFAMVETKMALIKLLQNFSLSVEEEHKGQVELVSRGAIVPKHEVMVKVTKRTLRDEDDPTRYG